MSTDHIPSKKRSRVWIASKGNEKALTLLEADGWEVHEVVKAPVCSPNSPEDIRQSMDLLQQIHREAHGNETFPHLCVECGWIKSRPEKTNSAPSAAVEHVSEPSNEGSSAATVGAGPTALKASEGQS